MGEKGSLLRSSKLIKNLNPKLFKLTVNKLTVMDQETRWLKKYNEVKEFIEREHRNPSKFIPEERGQYLNWIKHNRKLYSAGLLKEERVGRFKELLALMEEYKRVNQWG